MNSNANLMDTVENAMEPVQDSVRTAARTGSQEFRNLIADVEELIKRVAHVDDADLARVRAKLQNTLTTAKTALHDSTERVKTTARHAADTTDQYVHTNPWSAVGIAAAAGAAIAVLLSTRMHQR
jgi:ElaB/YqjD/DUF883 family membrane-anchored ribosome-binding protein